MTINGKIIVAFEELPGLLGLPDDISIEMISCSPDDVAGGAFIVHIHKPELREMLPLEHAPFLQDEQGDMEMTATARREAVAVIMRLYRGLAK